jgi:hypothetical protein
MNLQDINTWLRTVAVGWLLLIAPVLSTATETDVNPPAAGQAVDFDKQIAPILAKRCLSCHRGADAKGELDLSTREAVLKGGSSGEAAFSTRAIDSLIWQQIDSDSMPPEHPLAISERELIRQWLDSGAVWGSDPIDPFEFSSDVRAGRDWWSLQPLQAINVPNGNGHPIDRFLEAGRASRGLSANPQADKRTLIRRLTFDLLGLPPTPEEVLHFLADESSEAYETLVDRLLDSPHFGERWARHWLDVVRFGESNGFEYDEPRDRFWHYRNWVINAMNNDMPYDQFARMQIAGDAFAPQTWDAAAAAGYLVAGPHNTTLPANAPMRLAMAQEELEDLVGSVGQTFLGLTVHCARCHDHKFDPISQKDYYRLAATLGGVKHGERQMRVALTESQEQRRLSIEHEINDVRAAIEQMIAPVRKRLISERDADANKQSLSAVANVLEPQATATWEFDGDLLDTQGRLPLAIVGDAVVKDGKLVLDGKTGFAYSPSLNETITEKTLEVWVQLATLPQRGGGAISIETNNGNVFDAIVFGEREPSKWMAGSDGFARYESFKASEEEVEASQRPVHLAIVYHADGKISAYRDGMPYGVPYQSRGLHTYAAGNSRLIFGLRHSPAGGDRMLAGTIERAQFTNRALTSDEVKASSDFYQLGHISKLLIVQSLDAAAQEQLKRLELSVEQLQAVKLALEQSRNQTLYTCISSQPPTTHLLIRGDAGSPAEEVLPGGLSALTNLDNDWKADEAASDFQRRVKLAEWTTHRDNPLFARVIVNRLWQYHFGLGLVATPSDLGFNGGQPTHPELLDWLATELQRNGYRLKPIHQLIVTSEAYRQSSQPNAAAQQIDADNRYLWRKSPHRLEAETLRDAMLVVTDRLDRQVGGEGYRDMRHYIHKGSHFYELQAPGGDVPQRRTIYRFTPRGSQNPFLSTFDCPDPSTTTPRRAVTTTPLQALALLNNAMTFDMADQFAKRLEQEAGSTRKAQVALAYELAYSRTASNDELAGCLTFVDQHDLASLCRVIFNSNEFLFVR